MPCLFTTCGLLVAHEVTSGKRVNWQIVYHEALLRQTWTIAIYHSAHNCVHSQPIPLAYWHRSVSNVLRFSTRLWRHRIQPTKMQLPISQSTDMRTHWSAITRSLIVCSGTTAIARLPLHANAMIASYVETPTGTWLYMVYLWLFIDHMNLSEFALLSIEADKQTHESLISLTSRRCTLCTHTDDKLTD